MSKEKSTLRDRYSTEKESSKGGRLGWLLAAVVAVFVILIIVLTVVKNDEETLDNSSGNASGYNLVVMPGDNDESAPIQKPETNEIPMSYDVSMNSTWEFENAKTASYNAFVANIETNKNPVYFTVTRVDDESVVYVSPDIPVGGQLTNIKLDDESLTEGTYPCVVTYYLLGEERVVLSHVNISIDIVINGN